MKRKIRRILEKKFACRLFGKARKLLTPAGNMWVLFPRYYPDDSAAGLIAIMEELMFPKPTKEQLEALLMQYGDRMFERDREELENRIKSMEEFDDDCDI